MTYLLDRHRPAADRAMSDYISPAAEYETPEGKPFRLFVARTLLNSWFYAHPDSKEIYGPFDDKVAAYVAACRPKPRVEYDLTQ